MTNQKVAIITGGSRGIGLRFAKILAKRNYDIAICSINLSDLKKAREEIELLNVKCLIFKTDISNYKNCKTFINKAYKQFHRVDILINNVAIQGPVGRLWQNNVKEWEKTIQVNLLSTFYMTHLVIPYMLRQKFGKIINLSGGGATYARPLFSAYACSKTAILRLTETLAEELKGKNITVIALAPGATWTEMTKEAMKKSIKINDKKNTEELKTIQASSGTSYTKHEKVISYLLSENSKKLSGRLLHVDEVDKIIKRPSEIKPESGLLRRVNYDF
jgi:short-subunit dehydrogenase